jgi:hypothetical protein
LTQDEDQDEQLIHYLHEGCLFVQSAHICHQEYRVEVGDEYKPQDLLNVVLTTHSDDKDKGNMSEALNHGL